MSQAPDSISLYMTEGSSDKEYHAQLVEAPAGAGWLVNFQYGRRGRPLATGTKTASPAPYPAARKAYDALVASKTKKGYTPDVSGEVFQDTVAGEAFTGCIPQLPQTVRDKVHIQAMIHSADFVAQEKFDGENRQVKVKQGALIGINKRGMAVPMPLSLVAQVLLVGSDLLISAEQVGDTLHAFDIQELDGKDLRAQPYETRLAMLRDLFAVVDAPDVRVVETAATAMAKRKLMDRVRAEGGEGVVFKRRADPFVSGKRAASQSSTFKVKFTEDATVRVACVGQAKRSVEVEIDHAGAALALGKVSVPSNHPLPETGDLVSVTYLHLYEEGSLFQAQYKGVRTDCEAPDTLDMFKIKPKDPAPAGRKPACR